MLCSIEIARGGALTPAVRECAGFAFPLSPSAHNPSLHPLRDGTRQKTSLAYRKEKGNIFSERADTLLGDYPTAQANQASLLFCTYDQSLAKVASSSIPIALHNPLLSQAPLCFATPQSNWNYQIPIGLNRFTTRSPQNPMIIFFNNQSVLFLIQQSRPEGSIVLFLPFYFFLGSHLNLVFVPILNTRASQLLTCHPLFEVPWQPPSRFGAKNQEWDPCTLQLIFIIYIFHLVSTIRESSSSMDKTRISVSP